MTIIKRNIILRIATDFPQASTEKDPLGFIFCLLEAIFDECMERRELAESLNNNELVPPMASTAIEKSVELLKELHETALPH